MEWKELMNLPPTSHSLRKKKGYRKTERSLMTIKPLRSESSRRVSKQIPALIIIHTHLQRPVCATNGYCTLQATSSGTQSLFSSSSSSSSSNPFNEGIYTNHQHPTKAREGSVGVVELNMLMMAQILWLPPEEIGAPYGRRLP